MMISFKSKLIYSKIKKRLTNASRFHFFIQKFMQSLETLGSQLFVVAMLHGQPLIFA